MHKQTLTPLHMWHTHTHTHTHFCDSKPLSTLVYGRQMHFRCELDALHVFVFDFWVQSGAGSMCQAADLTRSCSLLATARLHARDIAQTRRKTNFRSRRTATRTWFGCNFYSFTLLFFVVSRFFFFGMMFADQPINSRMQPNRCSAFACIQVLMLLAQIRWG